MAAADPQLLFRQAEAFDRASRVLLPARRAGSAPAEGSTEGSPAHDTGTPDRFDHDPFALAPYLANSVFSLELYLKCLLMLVKGKYPQIHSPLALFHDLPEDETERVRKLHRQIFRAHFPLQEQGVDADPPERGLRRRGGRRSRGRRRDPRRARSRQSDEDRPPADEADARLDAILTGAKDAFTASRYAHEGGPRAAEGVPDVSVAIAAVRGRILSLEPGWGST